MSLAMEARDGVTAELAGGDAMLRLGVSSDSDRSRGMKKWWKVKKKIMRIMRLGSDSKDANERRKRPCLYIRACEVVVMKGGKKDEQSELQNIWELEVMVRPS